MRRRISRILSYSRPEGEDLSRRAINQRGGAMTGIALGILFAALLSTNLPDLLSPQAAPAPGSPSGGSPEESREILVWRAASPGSPEEAPWAAPEDELTVLILHRMGQMPPPTVVHPGTPLRLIVQRALAIPAEHAGEPFYFNALLPRELPIATVLIQPREDVLECWTDHRFHLVAPGSPSARAFRRAIMTFR
jgi:hypothetical protein